MISFNLSNIKQFDAADSSELKNYLEKIHAREQDFYRIVDDNETVEKVQQFADENREKFEHFVVLGIGGSALGAICIKQSLTHLYQSPKLFVLDNIDPVMIREIEDVIDPEKTLFIVITKSGGTPETLALYNYFKEKSDNFVFITDPEKGKLREIAHEQGIPAFDIPPKVGGRFSVLTPVGLLPAALLGLDIKAMIQGAQQMRDKFLNENYSDNLPFQLAQIQHSQGKDGKTIHVMMPYAQKLIRFADWYRQLIAESIGKDGIGLTPVNALGATDQHSQSQLYNDGPADKFFIFIHVENLGQDKQTEAFDKEISFGQLLHLEEEGTRQAYTKNNRPNITINLPKIDETTLGALFMLFQGATAFLGELFQINAFDQPGVELSKKITKDLLLNK